MNLVGMTLADALREIQDDEIVHIGSGTGFLFVGDKDTFEEDERSITEQCQKRAAKMIQRYVKDIERIAIAVALEEQLDSILDICDKINEQVGNMKPITERTVREIYPRVQGDGLIILIDGTENGGNWYKSEYDKEREKWIKNVCGL